MIKAQAVAVPILFPQLMALAPSPKSDPTSVLRSRVLSFLKAVQEPERTNRVFYFKPNSSKKRRN